MKESCCFAAFLTTLLALSAQGNGCLSRLPPYVNATNSPGIVGDSIQAIVPGYRFTCPGTVIGWGGCFSPTESSDRYYMVYQVWRERGPGCYHLVAPSSAPPLIENLLTPEDGCHVSSLSPDDYISVEEGDIVGFYSDYLIVIPALGLILNFNVLSAGLQMLTGGEYDDVEVYYTNMSVGGGIGDSYAAGASADECREADPQHSGEALVRRVTGAPIITVLFEPSETQQPSPEPAPDDTTPVSTQISTVIFSSFTPTTGGIMSTGGTMSTGGIMSTGASSSPSIMLTPRLDDRDEYAGQPTRPQPEFSSPASSSSTHHQPAPSQVLTPALYEGGNGSLTDSGDRASHYKRIAAAASVLVFLNVVLLAGTVLVTTLCIRRRRRRQYRHNNHDISSPGEREAGSNSSDRTASTYAESQPLNRSSSSDRVSMVSNTLYSRSPARGLSEPPLQEPCRETPEAADTRPAVESMIYNEAYGSFQANRARRKPGCGGPARQNGARSNTDSDGYEYVR